MPNCSEIIREGFRRLDNYRTDINNTNLTVYNMLSKTFNLCDNIQNSTGVYYLENFMNTAYTYLAMVLIFNLLILIFYFSK